MSGSQPLWRVGLRSGWRQVDLGANDEPSNPFKNPRKSTSDTRKPRPKGGRKGGRGGAPPTPPGSKKTAPPAAPTGSKSRQPDTPANQVKTPAKAGKSVGLRKVTDTARTESQKRTDERAKQLIEATRLKANQPIAKKDDAPAKSAEPSNPFKKKSGAKSTPRKGGRQGKRNRPQGPTKRVQKLNRGKYMEFKYDVRRILDEENVEDEHRSNVLGQTWAKGERQGVSEAKEFLAEKVAAGIISDSCSDKIGKLIDSLTTRR